ncbi:MAG: polysaccharide deacetylase family protein [Clostridia bacterium]|nr:polysaccharide deacetylase family protein [Clostridia bacterium]
MILSFRRMLIWVLLCCTSVFFLGGNIRNVSGDAGDDGVKLPILMYHHILKDSNKWNQFVISPQEFESDLKFLSENGYQSVVIEDLLLYQKGEKELPKKPVMITVDDGYLSVKEYMLPLLEKYEMRAVFSIIGRYTDEYSENNDRNVSYAHVNSEDLAELSRGGIFEIQNHTYDMHKIKQGRKGAKISAGESKENYKKIFCEDVEKAQKMISNAISKDPTCFTYPFGFYSKESEEFIKEMGFSASLSCTEGVNLLSKETGGLYLLKRFNRPHGKSAKQIFVKAGLEAKK